MKRIVAVVLLVVGVAHAAGESRRRAVGKPASGGTLAIANYIDTHIGAKLKDAALAPAARLARPRPRNQSRPQSNERALLGAPFHFLA